MKAEKIRNKRQRERERRAAISNCKKADDRFYSYCMWEPRQDRLYLAVPGKRSKRY
jgi:hypothetical protein